MGFRGLQCIIKAFKKVSENSKQLKKETFIGRQASFRDIIA